MKRLLRSLAPRFATDRDEIAPRYRPRPEHPVQVQINGRNSLDVLNARDVSVSGIGVFVAHGFEGCDIDSEVELVITLPSQRPFLAHGRVRHETHHEPARFFGVQFTQLAPDHADRIRAYLASGLALPVD